MGTVSQTERRDAEVQQVLERIKAVERDNFVQKSARQAAETQTEALKQLVNGQHERINAMEQDMSTLKEIMVMLLNGGEIAKLQQASSVLKETQADTSKTSLPFEIAGLYQENEG